MIAQQIREKMGATIQDMEFLVGLPSFTAHQVDDQIREVRHPARLHSQVMQLLSTEGAFIEVGLYVAVAESFDVLHENGGTCAFPEFRVRIPAIVARLGPYAWKPSHAESEPGGLGLGICEA